MQTYRKTIVREIVELIHGLLYTWNGKLPNSLTVTLTILVVKSYTAAPTQSKYLANAEGNAG